MILVSKSAKSGDHQPRTETAMTKEKNYDEVPPDPSALIESLRSVGYSLSTALADIIDNSIAAEAKNVSVEFRWAGENSSVVIFDDGFGMSEDRLRLAMRPGSRNPVEERSARDLGRFGLGLKTASLSHCRKLCVASKTVSGMTHCRTWDLDVLANCSEWRLLREPTEAAMESVKQLEVAPRGTAVVWSSLDRLIGSDQPGDAAAHSRFNDAIDEVRNHLALTFHRYIESKEVKITLNGKVIFPWDPFMTGLKSPSTATPAEFIPFGKSGITCQGFVLPHKDLLADEEYQAGAGPRGWTAHQGFYVYRNKRLLVYGDWLKLGRPVPWAKEQQYNLARLQLDIGNDADTEWHLDVKKSTARPPALVRDRLTDLAEIVRDRARGVFVHRGKYGRRAPKQTEVERPWTPAVRNNRRIYKINRDHPIIQAATSSIADAKPAIEAMLRLLEETVPVEQIWLDTAEQSNDHAPPYDGLEFAVIKSDMRRVVEHLTSSGIGRETAIERLRSIAPFNRYERQINEL